MGRPLKIKKTLTKDIGYPAFGTLENPVYPVTVTATEFYGVVGGNDSAGTLATADYPTVKIRVKIGANAEADGSIIRQKGAIKYLVTDGTNTGICVLSDLDDAALTDNTMTITMDEGDSTPKRISKLTNKWALDYTGGPGYSAAAVVQRIRYVANFFDGGSTAQKSGTRNTANSPTQQNIVTLGLVENNT
jgi:hypothetical protein